MSLSLRTSGCGIDPGLGTDLATCGVIELGKYVSLFHSGNRIRVRLPDEQVIAVGLHSDHMLGLDFRRGCVDQGFHTDLGASRVKALGEDAVVISRPTPLPHRQVTTVGNTENLRKILRPDGGGVDVNFPTNLDPAGIEALQIRPEVASGFLCPPGHHITTVGQGGNFRGVARACRGCIDNSFATDLGPADAVLLGKDALQPPGIKAGPGHNVTAIKQPDHRRLILLARKRGVDQRLAPHLGTAGVIALGKYSSGIAKTIAMPGDDKTTIDQPVDIRIFLIA
ncbi:hypothetical protein B0D71_12315 [Pseudomonas laurylsulfativorans]|uniref:Uncharacterized protein n=1 Tax=Pseudomonas laurylsulfativorans TaxID=1943631 RepID=A0A2S3VQN5_9PSED|nr:hypothetical protein B0D71_12315 [Pseudomonas laurylsulfativorans]